jgi:hypothetical protein
VSMGIIFLLLRDTFTAYLKAAWYVVNRFSSGEAGFPFYWTVNSLVAFALLSLCCVTAGRGLGRRSVATVSSGDRFFWKCCKVGWGDLVGLRFHEPEPASTVQRATF